METIKVKPWGEGQGEYVLINAEDFNPEIHEEFDAEPKKARRRRAESAE
jgi:hypothetical protein